jgi:hypothetical protein
MFNIINDELKMKVIIKPKMVSKRQKQKGGAQTSETKLSKINKTSLTRNDIQVKVLITNRQ